MELILTTPIDIKKIVDVSINEALMKFENVLLQSNFKDKKYEVKEVAKISRCSEQTIYKRIKSGDLKAERFGRKYLIPYSELFNSKNRVKSLKYKRNV